MMVALHGLCVPGEQLARFCVDRGIKKMSLFGSVLRDDFGPLSDIDVLVEFKPGVRVGLRFFEIERELSQLLDRKVDLNTLGFLSKYFRDRVLSEAKTTYDASR